MKKLAIKLRRPTNEEYEKNDFGKKYGMYKHPKDCVLFIEMPDGITYHSANRYLNDLVDQYKQRNNML